MKRTKGRWHAATRGCARAAAVGVAIVVCCVPLARAENPAAASPPAPAIAEQERSRVIASRFVTLDGQPLQLGVVDAQVRPVALVFYGPECPISNRYMPRLNEIARQAESAGVQFLGVLSDPYVSPAEAREHQASFEIKFPIVLDANGSLAERLRPARVPQAFVIGADDRLVYSGRIDDWYADLGQPKAEVTRHDLADAIAAAAKRQATAVPRTEAVGCRFESWNYEELPAKITYYRHVAPILHAQCAECHRAGQVGPFSLTGYDDAQRRAEMIAEVCREGQMPPWRAAAEYGHFRNERRLSQRELSILSAWAKAGAPAGDPADALSPPQFSSGSWALGAPDLVLAMPEPIVVPATGDDLYQYLVIPSELMADKMVTALEFRPGDPSVVHHAIFYLDSTGRARQADAKYPGPGFPAYFDLTAATTDSIASGADGARTPQYVPDIQTALGGWAPGVGPRRLPAGWGRPMPAASDLVLEIHYHSSGKSASDRSSLGLYFADQPTKPIAGLWVGTMDIQIEPGQRDYWRHAWATLPCDVELVDSFPHMHNLGKEFRVEATAPDGTVTPLIWIRDWAFRWQDYHAYAQPIRLARGTRIDAYMRYDNSPDNPWNPSAPPKQVRWGWQTTDEMGDVFFSALPADPKDEQPLWNASLASFMRKGALKPPPGR